MNSKTNGNACQLLLRDLRQLLIDQEWGGRAAVRQCLFCWKLRDVFPEGKHRAGCKQRSLLRRIDAVLRQMQGEGG